MPSSTDREIYVALRHARRMRWVKSAIFALMLGGLFVCGAIIAIGSIGAAMDAQTVSLDDDQ